MDPREIVVGPLTIWLAAAVEAEDDVDGTPGGNWAQLGTSGDENYTEDGVTVTHSQTTRESRVAGATGPVKVNRTEEALMIALTLMDMNLAQLTKLFNNSAKSTDNSPNIDFLGMRRGPDVTLYSLIAKGAGLSPSGAFPIQLYVPRCYQSADALAPVFGKNADVGYAAEFSALEYSSAGTAEQRFGRWVVQTS
tara:strand:- start:11637 stop:12218 length:582 start_codon:yes stop_codon:yes gene_type:complete